MNQKRNGTISVVDLENNCGLIVDENGQDIPFSLKDAPETFQLDTQVSFNIELSENGLAAINIQKITR